MSRPESAESGSRSSSLKDNVFMPDENFQTQPRKATQYKAKQASLLVCLGHNRLDVPESLSSFIVIIHFELPGECLGVQSVLPKVLNRPFACDRLETRLLALSTLTKVIRTTLQITASLSISLTSSVVMIRFFVFAALCFPKTWKMPLERMSNRPRSS